MLAQEVVGAARVRRRGGGRPAGPGDGELTRGERLVVWLDLAPNFHPSAAQPHLVGRLRRGGPSSIRPDRRL